MCIRDSPLCRQLLNGRIAVLLGLGLVKELGQVGQAAALGVVPTIGGGAEGRGSDGVQLVAVGAQRCADSQRNGVVDAVQEGLSLIHICLCQRDVHTLQAGEVLGHRKGLAEELLQLAGDVYKRQVFSLSVIVSRFSQH